MAPRWVAIAVLSLVAAAVAVGADETATPEAVTPVPEDAPAATRPTRPGVPLPPKPDLAAAARAANEAAGLPNPAPSSPIGTPATPQAPPRGPRPPLEILDEPSLASTAAPATELRLQVAPTVRVTADPRVQRGLYRVELAGQQENLGSQLAASRVDGLLSFSVVRLGRDTQRLDLRVDPRVRGVQVRREAADRVVLRFLDRAVRASSEDPADSGPGGADASFGYATSSQAGGADKDLLAILLAPSERAPTWVEWGPLLWPIGPSSPVPLQMRLNLDPHPVAGPPTSVREAWKKYPALQAAADLAQKGGGKAGAFRARSFEPKDDHERALHALARAWTWIQARDGEEPLEPGRSAEAASLAANLDPEADWVAWAEGLAGYGWEREHRLPEARYHYEKAARLARSPEEQATWALRLALVRVVDGEAGPGAVAIANTLGRLPDLDEALRFQARRAVAIAMWIEGDGVRAATLVDLLRREHPALASAPENDEAWGGIYLQSGRAATALPFLQRIVRESERSVRRQRARWWLHEAAVMLQDGDSARRNLLELMTESPLSVLVPLAKDRLLVLDQILGPKQGGAGRAELIQKLEQAALRWPDTPISNEALWLVGQLYLSIDLLEDGLHVYRWLEDRHAGSAAAYEEIVCRFAPRTFEILRARGELTRALGLYRTFLDDPRLHLCATPEGREDAAATALAADLPELGARWLGQAIAEGSDPNLAGRHLIKLAELYLAAGKTDAARQTVRYIGSQSLPLRPGDLDAAEGDIATAEGRWSDALDAYDRAIAAMMETVRTAAYIPTMLWRRAVALDRLGRIQEAMVSYRRALDSGGAPHAGNGWATLAALGSTVAEGPGDWEDVLSACDRAIAAQPDPSLGQSVAWLRAEALAALGRPAESAETVAALGGGDDVWALMARQRAGARDFDVELQAALGRFARPDP